jgi:hypothetical protein
VEGVRVVGFGQRAVSEDDAVRIEARVQCVDPLKRGLDDFPCGYGTVANQARLLAGPGVNDLDDIHVVGTLTGSSVASGERMR